MTSKHHCYLNKEMGIPNPNISPSEFDRIANDSTIWLPLITNIANATNCDLGFKQFEEGSNIVFASGQDRVIKLFPLFLEFQFKAEECALNLVYSQVNTKTPKLISSGYQDGWPFLVMEKVNGVPLSQKWSLISTKAKSEILFEIGEIAAAHHKIHVDESSIPSPGWESFVKAQIEGCVRRHTKLGVPEHLINNIENYLRENLKALPLSLDHPVLLTGEYTPGNILIELVNESWKISGLIDYGDAMVGFHEYDLLGPATFLASGNQHLLMSLLSGYGYKIEESDSALAKRLMTMLLLHRYSNLDVQIQIPDWKKSSSISDLQKLVFPLGH